MAPAKQGKQSSTKTKQGSGKKEKVFHPESRKAGQLARTQLRKEKLANAASKRARKHSSQGLHECSLTLAIYAQDHILPVDLYGFFYHAMPPTGVLSLPELHELVKDMWLTRHDAEIKEEKTQRRPGRPKSTKEVKLEELRLREAEDYRTGIGS
jgi:translation machinery-associated protein 16